MIIDQFWRPDRHTRSAIRRGDKLARAYFERKKTEYDLAMIARLAARRNAKRLDKEDGSYEVV